MKCEHCGKPIGVLSNYCEYCGKPVESVGKRISSTVTKLFKGCIDLFKKKKWMLPVILGVIVALIAVSVFINRDRNLDFTDYLTFEVSGYDGAGTLAVSVDYDKLAEAVLGKEPNKESKKEYEKYIKYQENKELLVYSVSATADKTKELGNGDYFLVTVQLNVTTFFEQNKISVNSDTYTKTFEIGIDTEKLTELTEVNIIDLINVEFFGKNGEGYANISYGKFDVDVTTLDGESYTLTLDYQKTYFSGDHFSMSSSKEGVTDVMINAEFENNGKLSNGDTVKMTISFPEAALAEEYGIKIPVTEKEYTVSGLE